MVRVMNLRQALFGLQYDLAEKLRTENNPQGVYEWLQRKVESIEKDLAFQEYWNKEHLRKKQSSEE